MRESTLQNLAVFEALAVARTFLRTLFGVQWSVGSFSPYFAPHPLTAESVFGVFVHVRNIF